MFSQEPRRDLSNHQLADVLCQLQFPEILSIDAEPPAKFQEEIQSLFPLCKTEKPDIPPALAALSGALHLSSPAGRTEYSFTSKDANWRISLTGNSICLACAHYTDWEDFARMLDLPLAAFIQLYHPVSFTRIGLRYVNFISRKALDLEDTPFRDLIQPCYLGILGEEDLRPETVGRCTTDCEISLTGSCRVKIHSGPGYIRRGSTSDPETKYIFDFDLYSSGNIPVGDSANTLQTLHSFAFPIFRGAITDTLFEAML